MLSSTSGSVFHAMPCIYVHLTSGDVEELCPADSVRVDQETVGVFNGKTPVAQFAAREVILCSHRDVSPFPFS